MRAFSFDKEPAFKSMEATSIFGIDDALIGAVIGGVGSIAGGAMGAKGAKNAAATAAAGNQDALQAEREAYLNARGALQPYVNRGNKAQGYLDALLYGHGSYADAPLYAPSAAESFDAVLKEQNPGAWATWQGWEQKLKPSSYTKGHRAVYGDFEGFLKATDPGAIQRAQESLNASAAPGASGAGSTITRDDAYANLQQTLPWQFNEQDYTKRDALNEEDYAKLNALNEEDYAKLNALNEEDYLKAQGFTNDEIAAWVANAQAEQDKSINALFNRGGLTGQVGATRRGVAQVGEEYARDRAQYEAGRRRADYEPYADRRVSNYSTYGDRRVANYDQFSKRRAGNYDTYAGGRLSAYGDYLDALSGEADTGYNAATGQASAGKNYASNYGNLRSQGAKQQAGYLSDSADAWTNAVGNAGAYLTYGLSRKNNNKSSVTIPGGYDAYEPVGNSYRGYDEYGAPSGYVSLKPRRAANTSSDVYSGLWN